ncbi:MAG: hypothetical protein HFF18_08515 [Oscillospiraceae bacterium]|nr:hypothetical protein [Oscillospiraceae bacterium]
MIGAINGITGARPVYQVSPVSMNRNPLPGASRAAEAAQSPQAARQPSQATAVWTAQRAADPNQPVQPVNPVTSVKAGGGKPVIPIREGVDPVEMAVRMRIRYDGPMAGPQAAQNAAQEGENAVQGGVEGAQKAAEEGKCQTCEERKYQDGSDDMGVSFQTPTRIDPAQVASAVRGHEMEHVVREQAKAQREDRKVVSQNVTLHTNICPECGKAYISGGTTRTVTASNNEQPAPDQQSQQQRQPFSAIA